MSKKRKAADDSGAEAERPTNEQALDQAISHAESHSAEKLKKPKKQKISHSLDVGPEQAQAGLPSERPSTKANKIKDLTVSNVEPEQAQAEQPSINDAAKLEAPTITEAPSEITAGEKRQAKSERPRRNKKGKIIHTREMALERIRLVREKKAERKKRLKEARLVPLTTPSSEPDALAKGSDFVPLFTEDTKPTPVNLEGAQTILHNGEKMLLLPKRSKKGLTRTDRKAKAEENRHTQKEKTAKRKEKKLRKLSVVNPNPLPEGADPSTILPSPPPEPIPAESSSSTNAPTEKQHRFILFIGNLPFSTTTSSLETHFSSLQPLTVRHSTDKFTKKSKGFAFLEFEHYDKMKTCLKLYHHSYFNPENPGTEPVIEDEFDSQKRDAQQATNRTKDKGRRINVELTAGGGGKGKGRQEKIKKKNTRLAEQRERRLLKEKKEKEKEQTEKPKAMKPAATGANADTRGDIHPSRMNRVKG